MRSRAALSDVSRSWYRFVFWDSIDPVLWVIAVFADRFYLSVYVAPIGTFIVLTLTARLIQRKYPVSWLIMLLGHTWSKWNSRQSVREAVPPF
jgi:hypothetical protein